MRAWLLLLVGASLGGCSVAEAQSRAQGGRCVNRVTWRSGAGVEQRCYPYRCGEQGCLRACASEQDCAVRAGVEREWPLACHAGECVPFPRGRGGHPEE